MKPRISVCLASYNGSEFIEEQILSILSQLDKRDELIISDDSSLDGTTEIIKKIAEADHRIRLFEDQIFKSPIYNFEHALKKANGDIIFLADQDDIWEPDKVRVSLNELVGYDLIVSDCKVVDINDQVLYRSFYSLNRSGPGFIKNLMHNSYLGCCLAFKKQVLEYALPFPKKIPMHDWWIGLIGEAHFKTRFLDESLVRYRRHGKNASPTAEKSQNSILTKVFFRFRLLWEILKSY